MGIQVNGTNDLISASDGSLSVDGSLNVGITTFHSTLAEVHNVVSTGVVTATKFVGKLVGDGSDISGISGFATALSSTPNTLLNECFKTTEVFTIGAGTSIKIESDNTSGNTAFTRLSRINVSTGATFHVSSGTTFIMNVLNVF